MRTLLTLLLVLGGAVPPAHAQAPQVEPTAEAFREDALAIEGLINSQYAYLDRFPDGAMPMSDALRAEAGAVSDRRTLLRYAEHAITALADHHAITGGSFADSWGLVPSYSDLWIEPEGGVWRITAVRHGSPAEAAGVRPGDSLVSVGDIRTGAAVASFWAGLGLEPPPANLRDVARMDRLSLYDLFNTIGLGQRTQVIFHSICRETVPNSQNTYNMLCT